MDRLPPIGLFALFLAQTLFAGCVASDDLIEVYFPEEMTRDRSRGVAWTFPDARNVTPTHAEVHWSVDSKRLDQRTEAIVADPGEPYRACVPDTDCSAGHRWVSRIDVPETGDKLYYQVHTTIDRLQIHSRVGEAELTDVYRHCPTPTTCQ